MHAITISDTKVWAINQDGKRGNTPMQRSRLEDSDWRVRRNALNALGNLEPAALAQHAGAMVARLEDSHSNVRAVAL